MKFSITTVDQAVAEAIQSTYSAQLAQHKAELMHRISTILSLLKKVSDQQNQSLSDFAAHKQEVHRLVGQFPLRDEEASLKTDYQGLIDAVNELIESWPAEVVAIQAKERYYRQSEDSMAIGGGKLLKRTLFLVSRLPQRTVNVVKKISGQPPTEVTYAEHRIPLRSFAGIYLREALVKQLLGQSYAWMRLEARTYELLFDLEDELRLSTGFELNEEKVTDLTKFVDEQYALISAGVESSMAKVMEAFKSGYDKAGTFELKSSELTSDKLTAVTVQNRKTLALQAIGWKKTHQTLLRDWQLNAQLRAMGASVRQEFKTLESRISEKQGTIVKDFAAIRGYLNEAKERAGKDFPVGELKKLLVKEKYDSSKSLNNKLLKGSIDTLINQNFGALVNRLDTRTAELHRQLPDKTAILKSGSYDVPIKSGDLQTFSPQELFAFESMPIFTKATEKLRQLITRKINDLVSAVDDLDDIVTFCLEAAISSLEQEDADPAGSLKVYQEGLERAINKLDESEAQLEELKENVLKEGKEAVDVLVTSIIELTSDENARELNLRISKAKALRSKEHYVDRLKSGGTRLSKQLTVKSIRLGRFLESISDSLQASLSRPTGEQKVSSEVSDFLADSYLRIHELPIVYQRLYKITALTDQGLFEGRSTELHQLKSAYQNWEQEKHASTVIVGEKWSGLTSLINHFLEKLKPTLSVIRIDPQHNISTEEELIGVMSSYLKKELASTQDVIDHINSLPAKKIIIVENLQLFFLKKVRGFQALQALFKIIAETDQQVFWLLSCTEYAWKYLESTNAARDHFRHFILTEQISNDQMVELIMKRNRISGYHVYYEVPAELQKSKKFVRKTTEEQQSQLKKAFFTNLIKFSKSNVSLGLIFWLLSTKEISEDTITIGTFKEPDLSFLKQLSMPKIFILNNLILHDGLTVDQLSEVMRMGTSTIQALVTNLEDDGVLITKEELHMVNPFVFRQIVNHLKLKNLIH